MTTSFATRTLPGRAPDRLPWRRWVRALGVLALGLANLLVLQGWRALGRGPEAWQALLAARQEPLWLYAATCLAVLATLAGAAAAAHLMQLRRAFTEGGARGRPAAGDRLEFATAEPRSGAADAAPGGGG